MNSFGRLFRVSIFGESHGKSVGIIIDGCPPGIPLDSDELSKMLDRRKPAHSTATSRKETDTPIFKSGIFNGKTSGVPILIEFENRDFRPEDYYYFREIPRPGHADFTSSLKYHGYNDHSGSGHFSGRLTTGLVAAGYFAQKILGEVKISAKITEAGGSKDIEAALKKAELDRDSIGGIIECTMSGLPVGLGEPFFDSFESVLSHIIFSIPAIKGIEFGAGFAATAMTGSEHNDSIISLDGKTETNNSGGINGGISNGNDIIFRVAVKPTSSTPKMQNTLDFKTKKMSEFTAKGRHDLCIALRMPVIIESAAAIAAADLLLINKAYD